MAINDNAFTRDDNTVRSERLTALSANIADYATTLALPAALVTQAQAASDAFNAAEGNYTTKNGAYAITLGMVRNLKKQLQQKYVPAKELLLTLFSHAPEIIEGYSVEGKLNEDISAKYEEFRDQVAALIAQQIRFTAANIDFLIPTAELTAMQTLQTSYVNALKDLAKSKGDKINAKKAERTLFATHSKMLDEIRKRALFIWPKDSADYYYLGMAPEEEATGQGSPDAPVPLYDDPNLVWEATANTTSYDVQTTTNEGATTTPVLSAQNVLQVAVPRGLQVIWARARARNANGVSAWSPWVIIPAMTPDMPGNLMHTPGDPGVTTCVVPPGAITVRMFYQPDGHPKTEIGVMTNGSYPWTLWLTPGTIFAQAEYPGGIVSAQATLRVE